RSHPRARAPPRSPPFPYTTLFRSNGRDGPDPGLRRGAWRLEAPRLRLLGGARRLGRRDRQIHGGDHRLGGRPLPRPAGRDLELGRAALGEAPEPPDRDGRERDHTGADPARREPGRLPLPLGGAAGLQRRLVAGQALAQLVEQRPRVDAEELAVVLQVAFDEDGRTDRVEALFLERGEESRLYPQQLGGILDARAAKLPGRAQRLADTRPRGRNLGIVRR